MKFPLIRYLSLFSEFLPFIAGLIRLSSIGRSFRLFFLFVIVSLLSEGSSFILQKQGVHNIWVIHTYILLSTVLLLAMYNEWFREYRFLRLSIWILNIIFVLFWIFSKWTIERFPEPPVYTLSVSDITLMGVSLLSFATLLRVGNDSLLREPRFWVSLGVLIFTAGNLTPFLFIGASVKFSQNDAVTLWMIPWWMNAVSNCCYTWAFLCLRRV
jgi:hypothetical protein